MNIAGRTADDKDTLIVFTTCNHIEMTVLALEYLKHSLDEADLIVVDDFSSDGTGNFRVRVLMFFCFLNNCDFKSL